MRDKRKMLLWALITCAITCPWAVEQNARAEEEENAFKNGYSLAFSDASGFPGAASVQFDILLTNPEPVQAFSIGMGFDKEGVSLEEVTLQGTSAEEADYFEYFINGEEGWSTAGVIVDIDDSGASTIESGVGQPVLGYVFAAGCEDLSPVGLRFEDGHSPEGSPLPVNNRVVVQGASVEPALENGEITFEEVSIESVTAATTPEEKVEVCWEVSSCEPVESLAVYRDGEEVHRISGCGPGCWSESVSDICTGAGSGELEITYKVEVETACGRAVSSKSGPVVLQCPGTYIYMGDANGDNKLDVADPVMVLNYLFGGGPLPGCIKASDANDDDKLDISDPVGILGYLFGGSSLVTPGGDTIAAEQPHPGCTAYIEVPETINGKPACETECAK